MLLPKPAGLPARPPFSGNGCCRMQERLLFWNCTTAFGSIHKVVNGPMAAKGTVLRMTVLSCVVLVRKPCSERQGLLRQLLAVCAAMVSKEPKLGLVDFVLCALSAGRNAATGQISMQINTTLTFRKERKLCRYPKNRFIAAWSLSIRLLSHFLSTCRIQSKCGS